MYVKRLEVVKLAGVPLIDYWVKLPQWWGLSFVLLFGGGLSALWAGATFWVWHSWLLFFVFLFTIIVAFDAWRLQSPRELRPRFVQWFVFLSHSLPTLLVGITTIVWYREMWTFFWAPAWCVIVSCVSLIVTFCVNRLQIYRYSATLKKHL